MGFMVSLASAKNHIFIKRRISIIGPLNEVNVNELTYKEFFDNYLEKEEKYKIIKFRGVRL